MVTLVLFLITFLRGALLKCVWYGFVRVFVSFAPRLYSLLFMFVLVVFKSICPDGMTTMQNGSAAFQAHGLGGGEVLWV